MEQAIFSMSEGCPVPTRNELFIDYGVNVSHTIMRIRLARPDLYDEYLRLEAAALEEAQRRVHSLVQANLGHEHRAIAQFRALQAEFGIGYYTMRRLRRQARGGTQERSAWDWRAIKKFITKLIKEKDATIITVAQVAGMIGPDYHIKNNGNRPPTKMSPNTLAGQLRLYPDLHKALLKLCVTNRQRHTKESK